MRCLDVNEPQLQGKGSRFQRCAGKTLGYLFLLMSQPVVTKGKTAGGRSAAARGYQQSQQQLIQKSMDRFATGPMFIQEFYVESSSICILPHLLAVG